MRSCPVCRTIARERVFSMGYRVPDGWPLPAEITWYTCEGCGMLYGDGAFDQAMLNEYYRVYYGYGVNSPDNMKRLQDDAMMLNIRLEHGDRVLDFGGAGDDGSSVLTDALQKMGKVEAFSAGAGDLLPADCDAIYASHVLEHVYDLPATMSHIVAALTLGGLLVVDVPDAKGLLERWGMPILDFNTKHLNHFTLRNLLDLGYRWGFEAVEVRQYELEAAPCLQVHFKRLDVARKSAEHIANQIGKRLDMLRAIDYPVNVWGLGDVTWHLLSQVDLQVEDYIDSDPAFRGRTYNGKPVVERPTNGAPILILAQGQRKRLIDYIRAAGFQNRIIEI